MGLTTYRRGGYIRVRNWPRANRFVQEKWEPDGIPQPAGLRRRPGTDRAARPPPRRDRPAPRRRRRAPPRLPRRRAGAAVRARPRHAVPDGVEPVRHPGACALPVPRRPRHRPQARRAEGRSRQLRPPPVALLGRAARGLEATPQIRPPRPGPRASHHAFATAAAEVLADGRRSVRHAPRGVHRRPRPTRVGEVEPGHVPRPTRRQRLRAGPRMRPALPDSPRHRRPPRRGGAARRTAARERHRRRPAGAGAGGGDAAAGGAARTRLRRRDRRPTAESGAKPGDGRPRAFRAPNARGGRLRHQRVHRPGADEARRPVRRPPRVLQPHAPLPGDDGRGGVPPAGRDLAVHRRRPAAAGRHLVRRTDPRPDRPRDTHRDSRAARRPRRGRRRRPSAAAGDRQRALRALRRATQAAGVADHRQRRTRAGATVAGEIPVHYREGGRPEPRHPRRGRVLPARPGARRLGDRSALPHADHDRHAGLQRRPGAERRQQTDGGRGRPEAPRTGDAIAPRLRAAGRLLGPAGGAAGRGGRSRTSLREEWAVGSGQWADERKPLPVAGRRCGRTPALFFTAHCPLSC